MPLSQYAVQYYVNREAMCDLAPMAVTELMHRFVRDLSPDWSTVRMDISAGGPMNSWLVRLYGEGIPRPGGDHG